MSKSKKDIAEANKLKAEEALIKKQTEEIENKLSPKSKWLEVINTVSPIIAALLSGLGATILTIIISGTNTASKEQTIKRLELKQDSINNIIQFQKEQFNILRVEQAKNKILILLLHKKWTVVGYNRMRSYLRNKDYSNTFLDNLVDKYNDLFEKIRLEDNDDKIGLKLKKKSKDFSLENLLIQ